MADIVVARGTIEIVPTMSGAQKTITNEMTAAGTVAGAAGGKAIGISAAAALTKVGGGLAKTGKVLSLAVTAPLVAFGKSSVQKFAEVDRTMALTNQTMGNTAAQADLLNKAMKEAAANSTFGMSDAAQATLNFARAGLTAEQAAATLAPAMNLAAGEGGDLDTVSAGLVATINGFHGSFADAAVYADVFAAACNNSALEINGLSQAFSVAAPVFASAGYAVNDAALYMGVMANNGIDASVAANSLKTGFAKLISPAKSGAEAMDALGISVTNADGSMKDSVTIQQELHDAFAQLSESEQIAAASAIFGKNQMAPWLALINTAPEDVNELSEALSNSAGTTEEMANAMMSGFGGSLEKLKSSIDVLKTSFGEALAPTISTVATTIQNLVDKFNSLDPAQQQTIAKIAMIAAAAGPVLLIGGKLIGGIGKIAGGLGGLAKGAGGVVSSTASLGSGLAAAIPGVLAFSIGVLAVATAIRIIGPYLDELLSGIATIVATVGVAAAQIITAVTPLVSILVNGIATIVATIGAALPPIIDSVSGGITSIVESISSGVATIIDSVSGLASSVGELALNISDSVTGVVTGVSDAVTSVIDSISGGLTGVLDGIAGVFDSIGNAAINAGTGFKILSDAVINLVNSTSAVDLGASLAAVAAGITSINTAATGLELASRFQKEFDNALKTVQTGLANLQKAFSSVKFSMNTHIAVPHFSMAGKFDAQSGSVPTVSVAWYKKAAEYGALFSSPQLIGVGDAAQPELLIGQDTLEEMLGGRGTTINLYIDGIKYNTDEYIDSSITDFVESMVRRGRMYGRA